MSVAPSLRAGHQTQSYFTIFIVFNDEDEFNIPIMMVVTCANPSVY